MAERLPKRPYLLRALIDWMIDSGLTPYVLVDATVAGVTVPAEHVQDGRIVLNLSPSAVRSLRVDADAVTCDSRFGGRSFALYLPMASIAAVYARETGEGMVFEAESFPGPGGDNPGAGADGASGAPRTGSDGTRGGHLKRIK
jgi:stringent starvation protein B